MGERKKWEGIGKGNESTGEARAWYKTTRNEALFGGFLRKRLMTLGTIDIILCIFYNNENICQ
jgi:hypothetical protein